MRLGVLHRQVRPRRPRPVHLVVALRALPPVGKLRLLVRGVADAVALDRVGGDRDAVEVDLDLQHQVREHQRVRAAPRLVVGLAHRPAGVAHLERQRRLALDVHRLVEPHLDADVLALAVGVRLTAAPRPQPRRRDHLDPFDHRQSRRRPPVNLVVGQPTDRGMVQLRVAAALPSNPYPGGEPQRVGADPHTVHVAVERLHLVFEMHMPGDPGLRGIGSRARALREAREHGLHRAPGPPAGIVETDLQPQSPVWFDLHRLAERHREQDRLAPAVGVRLRPARRGQQRRRGHRHQADRRRIGRPVPGPRAVHLVARLPPPARPGEVGVDVVAGVLRVVRGGGDRIVRIERHRPVRVVEVAAVAQADPVVVLVAQRHGVGEHQRVRVAAGLVRGLDHPLVPRVAEVEPENRIPVHGHRRAEGHPEADRRARPVGVRLRPARRGQQRRRGHRHRADRRRIGRPVPGPRAVHLVARPPSDRSVT